MASTTQAASYSSGLFWQRSDIEKPISNRQSLRPNNGPRDGFHRRKFFLETSVHQIRRLSPQHAQRERSSALHAEESFPTNRAFSDCRSRFADNISPADSGFRGEITIGNPKSEIANAPLAQLAEQVTLNHWVAGSIPARCILFLAGTDWRGVPELDRSHFPKPIINLVQHPRHAEPNSELRNFLRNRAVRICVSQEVADAITATGEVNGPVFTIPNAIELSCV